MFLVLLLVGLLGVWWYLHDRKRYAKYPPGPPRLPIIGNLHQIMRMPAFPATAFSRLSKMYGDIMFLKIGMQEAVVFNNRDVIHEMLVHDKTNDRTQFAFVKDRHYNKNLGIIWGNGKPWNSLRRFCMRNLRDFGFGKAGPMDIIVNDEFDKFTEHLNKQLSQAPNSILEMQELFSLTLVNVLWRVMSGQAYDFDDPKMDKLLRLNGDFFRSANMGFSLEDSFPFLQDWLPMSAQRKFQLDACQALYDYGKELMEEPKKNMNKKLDTPSFIDVFSSKVEDSKDGPDTDFTEEQFVITILDLLISGAETTSNSLTFGLLYLILNPEVQEKVQKEIDEVIDPNTPIESAMKSQLPYTFATVLEIFRYSTVIPTPASREATDDFYLQGHFIKKGTRLIFNLYSAHHSEEAFGDPKNFRPERFLNADGTGIDQSVWDKTEIFGAGRRFCVGQSLAEIAVFIYLASVLRKYTFVKVPGTNPTTDPILGLTTVCHPFQAQILKRKSKTSS